MNNDKIFDRFQERMEAKKAEEISSKPKLYEFPAQVKFKILAVDDEVAKETLEIIVKHLGKFDDIIEVESV